MVTYRQTHTHTYTHYLSHSTLSVNVYWPTRNAGKWYITVHRTYSNTDKIPANDPATTQQERTSIRGSEWQRRVSNNHKCGKTIPSPPAYITLSAHGQQGKPACCDHTGMHNLYGQNYYFGSWPISWSTDCRLWHSHRTQRHFLQFCSSNIKAHCTVAQLAYLCWQMFIATR